MPKNLIKKRYEDEEMREIDEKVTEDWKDVSKEANKNMKAEEQDVFKFKARVITERDKRRTILMRKKIPSIKSIKNWEVSVVKNMKLKKVKEEDES